LTISVVVAASGFNKVADLGNWFSQYVGLVPSDEYQLVILSLVGCASDMAPRSDALRASVDARARQVGRSRVS
jgi:hypothetical protein